MGLVFLDTSAILKILFEESEELKKFLEENKGNFVTSNTVLLEALYKGLRVLAEDRFSIKRYYDFLELIEQNDYKDFLDFLSIFTRFSDSIEIIEDYFDFNIISDFMIKFKLLPRDALIASTCFRNNIAEIFSYDSDFDRIPFLRRIWI